MNVNYFTAASKHSNRHSFVYHMSLETEVLMEDIAVNQKFPVLKLILY
jgi:hypothetical protein